MRSVCFPNQAQHVPLRIHHVSKLAGVLGIVIVGFIEKRGAVPHDSVDKPLQASNLQHVVAETGLDSDRGEMFHHIECRASPHPNRQLSVAQELLVDAHLITPRDVVDAGHAVAT